MNRLNGKVAFLTGGGAEIGRAHVCTPYTTLFRSGFPLARE